MTFAAEPAAALFREVVAGRVAAAAAALGARLPCGALPAAVDVAVRAHLEARLLPVIAPACATLLATARDQQRLVGITPADRFHAFRDALAAQPTQLWAAFPGLEATVEHMLADSCCALACLFERIDRDQRDLLPGGGADWHLQGFEQTGDSHCGGHATLRVTWTRSGPCPRQISWYYKPRSLAAEQNWAALLAWLNPVLPLSHDWPQVLDCGAYGWMAEAVPRPCNDRAALSRFHWRLGSLAAVLHLLLARDGHAGNLVAMGEWPVLVDAECLLAPRLPFHGRAGLGTAWQLQQAMVLPQVVRTGTDRWTDLSAVSGISGTGGPWRRAWRDAGTDAMAPVWQPAALSAASNRAWLDGEACDPLAGEAQFARGFSQTFRVLAAHRQTLLSTVRSPLEGFRGVTQRWVARPTEQYGWLLERSWGAAAWHQGRLERARTLRRRLAEDSTGFGIWPRLARHELGDLLRGDVPVFRLRCDQSRVYDSRARVVAAPILQAGLERARDHLREHFNEAWLLDQQRLIARAYAARRRQASVY